MIGQLLDGRYQIVRNLSSGGFAQTFVAEDSRRPGRPLCVVKRLQPSATDPHALEVSRRLFKREAEVLERLGQHPQIPRLLANFEEKQEFYLVEELIAGHPLTQEIVTGRPLAETHVMGILTEMLEILAFIHSQGVIHRDIKPSNIIRNQSDGKLVSIDFGAVKEVTTQVGSVYPGGTPTPTVIGTQGYMPIEQFHGHPRFNSDLYALGVIAIQGLTGLAANDISTLRDPHNPDRAEIVWHHRAPQVNPGLARIIDRLVVFDCNQRYQSATEVLRDLKALTAGFEPTVVTGPLPPQPVGPTVVTPPLQPPPPPQKNKLGLILAGIGGTTAILGGIGFGAKYYLQQNSLSQGRNFYYQGLEKVDLQDYKGAIPSLDEALKLNPKHGEAYYQRCIARYYLDQTQQAIDDCTQALNFLEKSYADIGAYLKIDDKSKSLIIDWVTGNSPAAKEGLKAGDKILEIDGKSTTNLSRGEAVDLLRQGQAGTPVRLKVGREDGITLELNLKRETVSNAYIDLAYNLRGLSRFYAKDYQAAIADFDAAIALDASYSGYYYNRGRARSKQGEKQAALQDLDKSIEINSSYAPAYFERGVLRQFLGQPEAAIKDLDRAIELQPNNARTYYQRGQSYLSLGNKQAAITDYGKAIEIDPKYINPYLARCAERSNLNDQQAALADCHQAVEIDSNEPAAYLNRGLVYSRQGDNQKAIADYTKAIKIDPNYAVAYNNRAIVRKNLNDDRGALEDYTQAIKINPSYASAYYNRGRLYGTLGDKQQAIDDLQKAAQFYLQQGLRGGYNDALAEIARLQKQPAPATPGNQPR
jgi:serine/threonine protein kinase/predicted TPR repeat methyltransferase